MDKRAVRIGSLTLGQGQPAVCIPVRGTALTRLRCQPKGRHARVRI